MATTMSAPHTVRTSLNYYLEPRNGGSEFYYAGLVSEKRRKHEPREVTIADIRGSEADFSLDKQGFQVVRSETKEKTFDDDAKIKDVYYRECEELLKAVTGATKVVPTSHVIRKQSWDALFEIEKNLKDNDKVPGLAAARYIHIDQSTEGAYNRIHNNFAEDDAERLMKTRWAIVNVWRPFGRPVERDPLALCDARSVPDADLVSVKVIITPQDSDKPGTGYNVKGGEALLWNVLAPEVNASEHKWYYCSRMEPDEALLIKQFDTKMDGRARRTPHTSFVSEEDHGPPRQSLEVRCFVFWEDQESD